MTSQRVQSGISLGQRPQKVRMSFGATDIIAVGIALASAWSRRCCALYCALYCVLLFGVHRAEYPAPVYAPPPPYFGGWELKKNVLEGIGWF